jgi:membrane protease YdiL (CAAX protease family)
VSDSAATLWVALAASGAWLVAVNTAQHRLRGDLYTPISLIGTAGIAGIGWAAGLDAEALGLAFDDLAAGLWWGAVVGVAGVAVLAGLARHRRTRKLLVDERMNHERLGLVARHGLVRIGLGTVLLEEVAFRGVVLALVAELSGLTIAVVATSVLFGLWHVQPALSWHAGNPSSGGRRRGRAVVAAVGSTFLAGIGLSLLRVLSGSLAAPIVVHWAINASTVGASWWTRRGAASPSPDLPG